MLVGLILYFEFGTSTENTSIAGSYGTAEFFEKIFCLVH
jgi:hypothetical protein